MRQEAKSDQYCFIKVGRIITLWGAIEKRPLSIVIFEKSTI